MNHNELLSLIKASSHWSLSFDESMNNYMGDENKVAVTELLKNTKFVDREYEDDSTRGFYSFLYFPVEEYYICLSEYTSYSGYGDEDDGMFMDVHLTERKSTVSYYYVRKDHD